MNDFNLHLNVSLPRVVPKAKRTTGLTQVPHELQLQIRARVAHYVQFARLKLGIHLPMPTCSFDLRGRSAGRAFYEQNHIQFNPVLLIENPQTFLHEVPGHEVAHLVVYARWMVAPGQRRVRNVSAHGRQWQSIMLAFGLPPKRTHSFNTLNATVTKKMYAYRCDCRPGLHKLSERRHKLAQAKDCYLCRVCRKKLRFEAQIKGEE